MIRLFTKKVAQEKDDGSFLDRLREGLSKTRSGLTGRLDQLVFGRKEINESLLEELEEIKKLKK